jgi:hypothetical protein
MKDKIGILENRDKKANLVVWGKKKVIFLKFRGKMVFLEDRGNFVISKNTGTNLQFLKFRDKNVISGIF